MLQKLFRRCFRLPPKLRHYGLLSLLSGMSFLLVWSAMAMPSAAHWEDMSTAKIEIQAASAQIDFTYPSQLTAFADNDGDGQISDAEITGNSEALKDFFQDRIRLEDDRRQLGALTVQPRNDSPARRDKVASKTHTDL